MTRARTLADLGSASLATDAELASEVATLDSTISGLALGKVLQVATGTTSAITTNNTLTYVDTGLSVTITPLSSTSTIYLSAMCPIGIYWASTVLSQATVRTRFAYNISGGASGSLSNEALVCWDNRGRGPNPFFSQSMTTQFIQDSHTHGTTSAITYVLQVKGNSTTNLNHKFNDINATIEIRAVEAEA